MPDLSLSVLVTRDQLALADLEINDHLNYFVSSQFLGEQVSWNRNQVSSIFLDGSVTVSRNMEIVMDKVVVEVLGADMASLYTNINTLLAAFKQDDFRLAITNQGQSQTYQCEAADYMVAWNGPRMIAHQVQVQFTVPRQPVVYSGLF